MMNALRLTDGFPLGLFEERTGLPVAVIQDQMDNAVQRGLLEIAGQHVRPTMLGQRFLNDLLQMFLTDDEAC
jgi:oxygen-independent coproporphyrinogen-3 oxidase